MTNPPTTPAPELAPKFKPADICAGCTKPYSEHNDTRPIAKAEFAICRGTESGFVLQGAVFTMERCETCKGKAEHRDGVCTQHPPEPSSTPADLHGPEHRWNRRIENGKVEVCRGDHERHEGCRWEPDPRSDVAADPAARAVTNGDATMTDTPSKPTTVRYNGAKPPEQSDSFLDAVNARLDAIEAAMLAAQRVPVAEPSAAEPVLRPGWRELHERGHYNGKPQYTCRRDLLTLAEGVVFWNDVDKGWDAVRAVHSFGDDFAAACIEAEQLCPSADRAPLPACQRPDPFTAGPCGKPLPCSYHDAGRVEPAPIGRAPSDIAPEMTAAAMASELAAEPAAPTPVCNGRCGEDAYGEWADARCPLHGAKAAAPTPVCGERAAASCTLAHGHTGPHYCAAPTPEPWSTLRFLAHPWSTVLVTDRGDGGPTAHWRTPVGEFDGCPVVELRHVHAHSVERVCDMALEEMAKLDALEPAARAMDAKCCEPAAPTPEPAAAPGRPDLCAGCASDYDARCTGKFAAKCIVRRELWDAGHAAGFAARQPTVDGLRATVDSVCASAVADEATAKARIAELEATLSRSMAATVMAKADAAAEREAHAALRETVDEAMRATPSDNEPLTSYWKRVLAAREALRGKGET